MLFHLRSADLITPVRRHDKEELTEALRLLGTSEVEGLLYLSTIFVEGEHDVELLEEGFADLLRRHKIKDLGGRREVEKLIKTLQAAELEGEILTPRYFIFDRDDAPTGFKNSQAVRILQWDRRCIENYLIDIAAITDCLKGCTLDGSAITNMGQVENLLRSLAMEQVKDEAIRQVYVGYGYKDAGLNPKDFIGKTLEDAGTALFARIELAKSCICSLEEASWKAKFLNDVAAKQTNLVADWDRTWQVNCDGKRLFKDLQARVQLNMGLPVFKKLIVGRMLRDKSTQWRSVNDLLSDLIKP
jgi:hypothetical protein